MTPSTGNAMSADDERNSMKKLLIEAKNEIQSLRRSNEILTAQMGIVEVFAAALGLKRGHPGASLDVVWALQQKIDELNQGTP